MTAQLSNTIERSILIRATRTRVWQALTDAKQFSAWFEVKMESGIEVAMINVLRQFPRKSRIINPVRHAAIVASLITPSIEARTNKD